MRAQAPNKQLSSGTPVGVQGTRLPAGLTICALLLVTSNSLAQSTMSAGANPAQSGDGNSSSSASASGSDDPLPISEERLIGAPVQHLGQQDQTKSQAKEGTGVAGASIPQKVLTPVERLRADADAALASNETDRARRALDKLVELTPADARVRRDIGRLAYVVGDFDQAARSLEMAYVLDGRRPDPELHYLRGEALYELGRRDEARREHALLASELGSAGPRERIQKLWVARAHARQNQLAHADALYETLWPTAPQLDQEAALAQVEAHVIARDWSGAEAILQRVLARDGRHRRAREILAYVYEASGQIDHELALRAEMASEDPTAETSRQWGRALERAGDFKGALARYEEARERGAGAADETLVTSLSRMRYRLTPEVAGAFIARRDPQADSLRAQAGVALPFASRHTLSLFAWHDTSSGRVLRSNMLPSGGGSATGLGSLVFLQSRGGASLLVGGDLRYIVPADPGHARPAMPMLSGATPTVGATAETVLPFKLSSLAGGEAFLRGDFNQQWNDSSVTVSEGGSLNGGAAHLYAFTSNRRFTLTAGTQIRQFRLAEVSAPTTVGMPPVGGPTAPGIAMPTSSDAKSMQKLFVAGGDVVLWSRPARMLMGESLDERLARRTSLSDALVLSYRHYQLFGSSSDAFSSRLVLAPRAANHVVSSNIRKVLADGRLGVDLRGSLGYDTQREVALYGAGGSLVLIPTWAGRLFVSYDIAREAATGLTGTRHTGWITYHADL